MLDGEIGRIYDLLVKIVWDEPKRLANLKKHGMDFADLGEEFFADAYVRPSHSKRWLGIGASVAGVIAVFFASLGREGISIVSMRPANRNERKLYDAYIKS